MSTHCTRPPEGWWCSLDEGHDGPCPTHPYYGTPLEAVLAPYMSPEQIARVRAQLEGAISPEMAERQDAAMRRIRERNRRFLPTDPRARHSCSDPEPQPTDGPDYHANHAAWRARNQQSNRSE